MYLPYHVRLLGLIGVDVAGDDRAIGDRAPKAPRGATAVVSRDGVVLGAALGW